MQRRSFVKNAAMAGLSTALPAVYAAGALPPQELAAAGPTRGAIWDAALAVLAGNVQGLPGFDQPVLLEGAVYAGVWQECGPHEALVYAGLRKLIAASANPSPLQVARANHEIFFSTQREDGQLAASVKKAGAGFAQIQMVVPLAATAWELAQQLQDEPFLARAYASCSRWDAWLRRYRNTRGTGLVEGFCTYDTGHDNSPRWAGVPNRCPGGDARICPPIAGLPRLCPDLSATVYGGRMALAAMAKALGKHNEAARWQHDAETLRKLILQHLYSPEDAAFYDLDTQGKFVRVRSDVISRVLGEHVLQLHIPQDRAVFDAVWARQMHNPAAFWTPFPFPSIALNDPAFVRPIPRNSWGGAAQALTALRTLRWMDHYAKAAEQRQLMQAWVEAIERHGEFRQQMDPVTGDFTQADPGGYSPAALAYLEFSRRLATTPSSPRS